ncbi:MAG: UTP--glucose-1-phosphate uridylyltransferase [Legionellaceae bacterium]
MNKQLRKAVFPVAGLGSRFLPATKANPKEMLPIVDKPLIQYAVEEAIAAGIDELIFVTSSTKRAIEDHFDSNYELEAKLISAGKEELADIVRSVLPKGVQCAYIRQPDALGLGHAVLCAKSLVGNEPFALLLADDLIDGKTHTCLEQMLTIYENTQHNVIAVQQIPLSETSKYGIIDVNTPLSPYAAIQGIVEKPLPADAPSHYGVVGRYILNPTIFSLLEATQAGKGGEIQLTDALAQLLKQEPVLGFQFNGIRYDCGSKLGYIQATIAYALKHNEIASEVKNYLVNIANSIEKSISNA